MGWNTTVVILNDAVGKIEEDPEFGSKLARAIGRLSAVNEPVDVSAEGSNGVSCAAKVIETHHMDDVVTVDVGGNTAVVVTSRHDPRFPGVGDDQTHECFACGRPHAGLSFENKYCTTCGSAAQERRTLYDALHYIEIVLRDVEDEKAKTAWEYACEALIVAPMGERLMVLDWRAIMEGRMTKEEAYEHYRQETEEMIAAGKRKAAERKKAEQEGGA